VTRVYGNGSFDILPLEPCHAHPTLHMDSQTGGSNNRNQHNWMDRPFLFGRKRKPKLRSSANSSTAAQSSASAGAVWIWWAEKSLTPKAAGSVWRRAEGRVTTWMNTVVFRALLSEEANETEVHATIHKAIRRCRSSHNKLVRATIHKAIHRYRSSHNKLHRGATSSKNLFDRIM